MLEKLAREKHSSLLRKSVNYGGNKFYDTGPGLTAPLKEGETWADMEGS
jgi:hypothetical protein